ncbi:MAG: hypothetical protein LAT77_06430 [Aliidiomarina sp.]|uniref:hypothetical protein n=1 Tax=Aliidiomarina sp. TaxID=1872439 RepID=UPI0025B7AA43|nr:hypothetical protein [Aliidiomarina sp.]MCH8501532.1 hypothetical protein [Aliidiomarina sp.]
MEINTGLLIPTLFLYVLWAVINYALAKAGNKPPVLFGALSLIPGLNIFITLYLVVVLAMKNEKTAT